MPYQLHGNEEKRVVVHKTSFLLPPVTFLLYFFSSRPISDLARATYKRVFKLKAKESILQNILKGLSRKSGLKKERMK